MIAQVTLDAAFATLFRDVMASRSGPIYLWADSSPQVGYDWLLSMFDFIPSDQLLQCAKHAQNLFSSTERISNACQLEVQTMESIVLDEAKSRDLAGQFLKGTIKRHTQMPMGLGSGATALENKCQAMAIKFAHESHSMKDLRAICAQVVGVTVDLGVESGLAEVHGGDVVEYLPAWMKREDRMREDCGLDSAHVCSERLFESSVISAGLDHVANNLQDAMDRQLQGWEDWLPGFKAVTHILSHRWLLQRLVATCVIGTGHASLARCFETCVQTVAQWRWGTICKTLPDVLRLERALRIVWNQEKFLMGGDQNDARLQSDSFNASLITSTIHSHQWWRYAEMILHLHEVGNFPSAWGSGCACHEWLGNSGKPGNVERAQFLTAARESLGLLGTLHDGVGFDCPLKGKRAPEMANGKLLRLLKDEAEAARVATLLSCSSLEPQDQEKVLSDFKLGVDYIAMYVEIKLGQWWQSLPWMLASLALPQFAGAGQSKDLVASALAEFNKLPCDHVNHHPLTWKIFRPGSETRSQIDQLVEDETAVLSTLSAFYEEVCKLSFIPVVERIVEGAHSLVHRHSGYRKVTGAYISCAMRLPEIDEMMCDETSKTNFVVAFHRLRGSRALTKAFRLQDHPKWLELTSKPRKHQSGHRKLCNAMLYSTDTMTMFVEHKAARAANECRKQQRDKALASMLGQAGKVPVSWSNVLQKALFNHVADLLQPGEFYSIPASGVATRSSLTSLRPLVMLVLLSDFSFNT